MSFDRIDFRLLTLPNTRKQRPTVDATEEVAGTIILDALEAASETIVVPSNAACEALLDGYFSTIWIGKGSNQMIVYCARLLQE